MMPSSSPVQQRGHDPRVRRSPGAATAESRRHGDHTPLNALRVDTDGRAAGEAADLTAAAAKMARPGGVALVTAFGANAQRESSR